MKAEDKLKSNFYNGLFLEINSGDVNLIKEIIIDYTKEHMRQLFQEIKHGDQEHQDWLENKIEDYIKSNVN